jgi:hypothetical protein
MLLQIIEETVCDVVIFIVLKLNTFYWMQLLLQESALFCDEGKCPPYAMLPV